MQKMSTKNKVKIEIGDVNSNNAHQLKVINITTLPVRYTDSFYRDLIAKAPQFLKFAYLHGFAVGDICARVESHTTKEGFSKLYIMTIGVLPAYRRQGIASQLLDYVLSEASKDKSILEVYLHVQTSNQDAKNFYLQHGFEVIGSINGYYKRIQPPDCFILGKSLVEGHEIFINPVSANCY